MNRLPGAVAPAVQTGNARPVRILYTPDVLRRGVEFAHRIRNLNLRRHLRDLARARRVTDTMPEVCRELFTAVESRCGILTELHPREFPAVPGLLRVAAYADSWVRPLAEWRAPALPAREQWDDLVSYLFDLWPVPRAFAGAWLMPGPLLHQARDWYLHLTRGGSIRCLPGMPALRRKAAAALAVTPLCQNTALTVRAAQLESMHCPVPLREAVMQSAMARDFANDALWLPLIEKCMAAEGFDPRMFGVISDGLQHTVQDAEYPRALTLLRLPVAELLRFWTKHWSTLLTTLRPASLDGKAADFTEPEVRRAIRKAYLQRWQPVPGVRRWETTAICIGRRVCRWVVEELLSLSDLIREGRSLHHCAGGYGQRCLSRYSAVFRVRCEERLDGTPLPEASCTIEVLLPSRRMVQMRGRWNWDPHPATRAVVRQWAHENGITPMRE